MPYVMSLEGPQLRNLDELRGQLYAAAPRRFWRASAALNGMFDPFMLNKLWVGAGLVLGAWLAGSAKGRSLVAKVARR